MRAAILTMVAALLLQGCCKEDKKERQRIFLECLSALPAGPASTKYNDWAEIVDECDTAAARQAGRVCQ